VTVVLRDNEEADRIPPPPPSAGAPAAPSASPIDALLRAANQGQSANRAVGILPLDITFPEFGSTIYLASELTPETQTAELGLEYHRIRGN
jgi:hypothetical protein